MKKNICNYYKNFDLCINNRLEKLKNEYSNPYGYNIESNCKKQVDNDKNVIFTNQDYVKTKEYFGK